MLPTTCSTVRQAGGGLGRGLLGGIGAVAGVDGVLVGFVGLGRGQLDALLRARIDVLDHLAVGGGEFIELVDAIADRRGLALHVLLAGKRIQLAPESFVGIRLQRMFAGRVVGLGSGCLVGRRARGRGLGLGVGTLLRICGEYHGSSQQQRGDDAVIHVELPPSGVRSLRTPCGALSCVLLNLRTLMDLRGHRRRVGCLRSGPTTGPASLRTGIVPNGRIRVGLQML